MITPKSFLSKIAFEGYFIYDYYPNQWVLDDGQ